MTLTKRCSMILAGLMLIAGANSSHAVVIVNAVEVGGNVELTASGNLNVSGLQGLGLSSATRQVFPTHPLFVVGNTGLVNLYQGITGPGSFGTGGQTVATSGGGDLFGINQNRLVVPNGFVSGSAISGNNFFSGKTFASLGMTPGTYTWNWASDSVKLNVIIPEPTTSALALAALCLAMSRRRAF